MTASLLAGVGRARWIAVLRAASFTLMLAALIIVGSRNLQNFDAALVGYTFAVLFSTFGIVYRYSMWLQRPPTRLYWRRGWQVFFRRRFLPRNAVQWVRRLTLDFALNRFIANRNRFRWLAHWFIMWGCVLAFAITFPLVFGWIHFETLPGNLDGYETYLFGFPVLAFGVRSLPAFLIFHGLVWSAFAVIIGVMVAMRRRMRDHGAAAVQKFRWNGRRTTPGCSSSGAAARSRSREAKSPATSSAASGTARRTAPKVFRMGSRRLDSRR